MAVADRNRHTGCVVARSLAGHNLDLELHYNSAVLGSRQVGFARDNVQASNLAGLDGKPVVDLGHKEYTHPAAHQDKLVCRVAVVCTVPADHALNTGHILASVAEACTMDFVVRKECEKLRYRMEHLAGQKTMAGGVAALVGAAVG